MESRQNGEIDTTFNEMFHEPVSKHVEEHDLMSQVRSILEVLSLSTAADAEGGDYSDDDMLALIPKLGGVKDPQKAFHRKIQKAMPDIHVFDCTDSVRTMEGWLRIQSVLAYRRGNASVMALINKTRHTDGLFGLFPQGALSTWMAVYKDNYVLVTQSCGQAMIRGLVDRTRDEDGSYSYECSICMENFMASITHFKCRHIFCVGCTSKMKECPLCRAKPHTIKLAGAKRHNKKKSKANRHR